MKQIETRLTELEARRTGDGLTAEHLTDKELIGIIRGDKSAVISDAELERIIAAEAVADQGSRSDQAGYQ
jgi:hypothetical protein